MMILRIFTLAILCLAVISASPTHHKGSSSIRLEANLQANPGNPGTHGKAKYDFQDDVARLRQRTQNLQKQIAEISKQFVELAKDSIALGVDLPISALKGMIGILESGMSSIANMGIFKDVAGSFSKIIDFAPKNHGSGLFGTGLNLPGIKTQGHIGFNGNGNQGFGHNPMTDLAQMFNIQIGKKDQNLPTSHQGGHQGGGFNFDTASHGSTIPNSQPVYPHPNHPINPGNQRPNVPGHQHGQQQPSYPQLPNLNAFEAALNGAMGQTPNFLNPNQKNQGPQVPQNPTYPQYPTSNPQPSLNGQGAQGGSQSPSGIGEIFNIPNLQDQNVPVDTNFPPFNGQLPSSTQDLIKDGADALAEGVMSFENPGGSGIDVPGSVNEAIDALKDKIPNVSDPSGAGADASGLIKDGLDTLKEKIPDSMNPSGSGSNPLDVVNGGIDAVRENLSNPSNLGNMEGLVPDSPSGNPQSPTPQSDAIYPGIQPLPSANTGFALVDALPETMNRHASTQERKNPFNRLNIFGK